MIKKQKESLYVALFTQSERDGWIAPGMLGFLVGLSSAERSIQLQVENKKPIDFARNLVVKDFLASGATWLLMIDNDMGPAPNLLDMLDRAEPHMKILAPKSYHLATVRSLSGAPDTNAGLIEGWQPLSAGSADSEWRELAWAATGVMFVHRDVFQRMGTQGWFRFTYDANGQRTNFEDIHFCQNARRLGFSVWGNQHFESDHFKTVSLSSLARMRMAVCPTSLDALEERGVTVVGELCI